MGCYHIVNESCVVCRRLSHRVGYCEGTNGSRLRTDPRHAAPNHSGTLRGSIPADGNRCIINRPPQADLRQPCVIQSLRSPGGVNRVPACLVQATGANARSSTQLDVALRSHCPLWRDAEATVTTQTHVIVRSVVDIVLRVWIRGRLNQAEHVGKGRTRQPYISIKL